MRATRAFHSTRNGGRQWPNVWVNQEVRGLEIAMPLVTVGRRELLIPLRIEAQDNRKHYMQKGHDDAEQQWSILRLLRHHMAGVDRDAIEHITYTRIGIGRLDRRDNLPFAFKHVVDICSAWMICGDGEIQLKRIGRYDGMLEERGWPTWSYAQRTEPPPRARAQGISLTFRYCRPFCH